MFCIGNKKIVDSLIWNFAHKTFSLSDDKLKFIYANKKSFNEEYVQRQQKKFICNVLYNYPDKKYTWQCLYKHKDNVSSIWKIKELRALLIIIEDSYLSLNRIFKELETIKRKEML